MSLTEQRKRAEKKVEIFNKRYRVGRDVIIDRGEKRIETKTIGKAYVVGGKAVIDTEKQKCVELKRVFVLFENRLV